jgi:hypothetical protein
MAEAESAVGDELSIGAPVWRPLHRATPVFVFFILCWFQEQTVVYPARLVVAHCASGTRRPHGTTFPLSVLVRTMFPQWDHGTCGQYVPNQL